MTIKIFKAFCDENRLQIIEMLRNGEKCGCILLEDLKISQPTLSHHMKVLCDSGIIEDNKKGKWIHYTISNVGVERAIKVLMHLTAETKTSGKIFCCTQEFCPQE
ncbi:MAG: metalloregulator ArsR/SmtB family transcription factor [Eubacteriales bacterium]|nr:metalloregulator ArsR/SmtB family transcription factor [Eubacteriales bacterium]